MRTKVLYITSAFVLCGAVIIWFNKAFFIGLPNFFAWFIAGVTVVFLFFAIIIKNVPAGNTQSKDHTRKNKYEDRREFPRVQHKLKQRPRFQVAEQELAVLDISERGICFQSSAALQLKDWVRGTLVFSDESTIDISGIVARKQGDSVSLQLITTIPAKMIDRETVYHLSEPEQ